MTRVKGLSIAALSSLLVLMIGCGRTDSGARVGAAGDDKVLNLYIWADDVAPDTISSFEKLTGVRVHVSYFDSPETLEARMLAGAADLMLSCRRPPSSGVTFEAAPLRNCRHGRELRHGNHRLLSRSEP